MGLLDSFNFDDPRTLGLLRAGFGIMGQAGDASRPFNVGQALGSGLDTYMQTLEADRKRKAEDMLIKDRQDDSLYQRQLRQAQAKKFEADALRGQQREMMLGELAKKMQADPNYRPSQAEMLMLDSDAFAKNLTQQELFGVEPKASWNSETKQWELAQYGNKGGRIWQGKAPDNFKMIAGDEANPYRAFDPRTATIGVAKLAGQPSGDPVLSAPNVQPQTNIGGGLGGAQIPPPVATGGKFSPMPQGLLTPQEMAMQQSGALYRKKAPSTLDANQTVKLREAMAKDLLQIKEIDSTIQSMNETIGSLKDNPRGVKGITGLESYLPNFPNSKSAQADVDLKNLIGKVTALGKSAASMSGSIGTIANQEWGILREMVARIDPTQGDVPLMKEIKKVNDYANSISEKLKDTYKTQYKNELAQFPEFSIGGTVPQQAESRVRKYNRETKRIE